MKSIKYFVVLATLLLALVTSPAVASTSQSQASPPDFWCIRYTTHGDGNNMYGCWCLIWAPNHKICLVISGHRPKALERRG